MHNPHDNQISSIHANAMCPILRKQITKNLWFFLDYPLLFRGIYPGDIYPLMISTNQNVIYIDNIKCQINESIFSKKNQF